MATSSVGSASGSLSSIGLGSGLDVNTIISQLRTIEEKPLTTLQTKATLLDTKISAFGQIQSLFASLGDAAGKLAQSSTWNARTVTSSNPSAVSATASNAAAVTTLTVEVQQLAKPQIATTTAVPAGKTLGAGTLTLQLGTWADDGNGGKTFTAGSSTPVTLNIAAGTSLSGVAAQINQANAGVSATVVSGTNGAQLVLRSKNTGAAQGFQMSTTSSGTPAADQVALDTLTLDQSSPGMQWAQDARASINGIAVQSASNTLNDAVTGMSITLAQTTAAGAPVQIDVGNDTASMQKAVQDFVSAYNALNQMITNLTSFDSSAPQGQGGSLLQGDSTVLMLQRQLRNIVGSVVGDGGAYGSLADIGISMPKSTGGKVTSTDLQIDTAKLSAAFAADPDKVKNLFTADTGNSDTKGIALKLSDFTTGVLGAQGIFATKSQSLQTQKKSITDQEDRISARIDQWETNLRKQYTALDSTMAQMTALNNYVSQQIAQWNKTGNNNN
ncbi:flagellar filament capping protein FliD [Extensimonas vulgaris]|uniref:Flagellar hook-associated protein 2 n=1 Tax=Extensimonas vulgaris TaxID=1031594 RepID=A0A369ADW4_9BURK|nr:flagellar filament capping protein FliD [Extensimonas vulgaris]RCX07550.1 flagellar hook-associated protein 2 [Extensimonas vulgaris]TWI41440.1 flagellar hook-associated protein 2 [Extensimonas vulgaris]TXD12930.1 flagellar cap protein FliD [Extensimonas vulgaris]